MSNKKIFKKLYSEKINKDDNYRAVLERIENNSVKDCIWKKVLIPVCSLIIICGLVLININENTESFKSIEEIKNTNRDYDIYINDSYNTNSSYSSNDIYNIDYYKKVDIDYEELIQSSNYSFLIDLEIPDDLNDRQYKKVYVNENSGHNLLQNYEFLYQHDNRKIMISFSDKDEILKNESYEDNIKISKIDDTEVVIYQDGKLYIATFIYNDMSFTIKTNNIKKEELINLLISIIE